MGEIEVAVLGLVVSDRVRGRFRVRVKMKCTGSISVWLELVEALLE